MELEELGLTNNEAKAYEAMLNLGKSTAAQISKKSGVPYGRIYPVLESLESKGFIKTIPEETRKFVPADPNTIETLAIEKRKKFDAVIEKIKSYKTIYQEQNIEAVQISHDKHNFYKLIRELKPAKKTSYNIKYSFDLHPEFIREINKYKKEKIDYNCLGRIDKETINNVTKFKKITPNIKKIDNEGVAVSIIDDEQILISLIKSNSIMLIEDKSFVKLMRELFINYYNHAQ